MPKSQKSDKLERTGTEDKALLGSTLSAVPVSVGSAERIGLRSALLLT